jgi:hypothetical protein
MLRGPFQVFHVCKESRDAARYIAFARKESGVRTSRATFRISGRLAAKDRYMAPNSRDLGLLSLERISPIGYVRYFYSREAILTMVGT